MTATDVVMSLAFDDEGAGTPVVFLHGLTFDRRTWRPIIDRLAGGLRSINIDLPAHGDSGGDPAPLDDLADQVHQLLRSLEVVRPVVVGHSMSGGLAMFYGATYPTRGVVTIDNGPDIRPFARLVQHLEPALCGPGFTDVWRSFEGTLGLELIPEPMRSLVLQTHRVRQETVLGYWQTVLRTDPDAFQALIDAQLGHLDVPLLGVFGRPITPTERERFAWLSDAHLEEWAGDGHFVHLVEPDRFATRLREFVDHCTPTG
jgi:pimeloyl-ACP methyl ester carboxylesterase